MNYNTERYDGECLKPGCEVSVPHAHVTYANAESVAYYPMTKRSLPGRVDWSDRTRRLAKHLYANLGTAPAEATQAAGDINVDLTVIEAWVWQAERDISHLRATVDRLVGLISDMRDWEWRDDDGDGLYKAAVALYEAVDEITAGESRG